MKMLIYLHCCFSKRLQSAIQMDLKWGQKALIQTLHIVTFMDLAPPIKSFFTKECVWYGSESSYCELWNAAEWDAWLCPWADNGKQQTDKQVRWKRGAPGRSTLYRLSSTEAQHQKAGGGAFCGRQAHEHSAPQAPIHSAKVQFDGSATKTQQQWDRLMRTKETQTLSIQRWYERHSGICNYHRRKGKWATWDDTLEKVSCVLGCLEATEEEEMLQSREIMKKHQNSWWFTQLSEEATLTLEQHKRQTNTSV